MGLTKIVSTVAGISIFLGSLYAWDQMPEWEEDYRQEYLSTHQPVTEEVQQEATNYARDRNSFRGLYCAFGVAGGFCLTGYSLTRKPKKAAEPKV